MELVLSSHTKHLSAYHAPVNDKHSQLVILDGILQGFSVYHLRWECPNTYANPSTQIPIYLYSYSLALCFKILVR